MKRNTAVGGKSQSKLMWEMVLNGLGTAAPASRYTQKQCWEALKGARRFGELNQRSRAILRKVLNGNNGISSRHLSLAELGEAFDLNPDVLQSRFLRYGPALATAAAQQALEHSHAPADSIDAVLVSTCTGYLCPGLTSYLIERLGLRHELLGLDLVGQGCGAALPNLRAADALLSSGQFRRVLCVCVEVCSAAFYLDDDPGVLISACLFGDGAGAAVLSNEAANGQRRLQWIDSISTHEPALRDSLRFEQRSGMLRNILSPEVPQLAAKHSFEVMQRAFRHANVSKEEITGWLFHPGGRDVLAAVRQRLGLREQDLRWSADVLAEYGNLSSASLFFVLENALRDTAAPGYWWMGSFGAGFTAHGALWRLD